MNNILSKKTEKFFAPTEDELQKEKLRYGNLFMNARKKQIEQLFRHMNLIDKFTNKEQQTSQDKYGYLLNKYCLDEQQREQQNINSIHSRYGHLLDKYIK